MPFLCYCLIAKQNKHRKKHTFHDYIIRGETIKYAP